MFSYLNVNFVTISVFRAHVVEAAFSRRTPAVLRFLVRPHLEMLVTWKNGMERVRKGDSRFAREIKYPR